MSFDPQKVLREQQEAERSSSWILTKIHEFNTAHNRLKHHVHTAWRYPLPPWGRAIMGCVYFSIPVFVGYGFSSWIVSQSEATVEERLAGSGSASKSIQGLGDKTIVKDESGERVERIGAGGWGGGVHLVTSDQATQDINRVNLERFLKKQRRHFYVQLAK